MIRSAVFLDRDGVINKTPKDLYITSWSEFEFIPGVLQALHRLTDANIPLFIVSNQAGIGKGLVKWDAFQEINYNMLLEFNKNGVLVSGIYFCPHIPEADCPCRKPKPELFFTAARDFNIDLASSFFVGDTARDLDAGKRAGCKAVFVTTGQETIDDINNANISASYMGDSLEEAASWILSSLNNYEK